MSQHSDYEARLDALEAAVCKLTNGAYGCPEEGSTSPDQTRGSPNPGVPWANNSWNKWIPNPGVPWANNNWNKWIPNPGAFGFPFGFPDNQNSGAFGYSFGFPDNQSPQIPPGNDKKAPQEKPSPDKQNQEGWWKPVEQDPKEQHLPDTQNHGGWWKPVEEDPQEQHPPDTQNRDDWWRPVEQASSSPSPTRGTALNDQSNCQPFESSQAGYSYEQIDPECRDRLEKYYRRSC